MSQEHRLCTEIYARLFNLIDRTKRIAISPDGVAKLPGFSGINTIPDLCFTIHGCKEVCIEAKITTKGTRVRLLKSQRNAWFGNDPAGQLRPQLWIIADQNLAECWLLAHCHVQGRSAQNKGPLINLWPNDHDKPDPCTPDELAPKIIAWVRVNPPGDP
jgi:hypothetical protein